MPNDDKFMIQAANQSGLFQDEDKQNLFTDNII